jgi:multidrug efflux pump
MQPVQDLTVEDRVSRTQYQYSWKIPDAEELAEWVPRFLDEAASAAGAARRGDDQQNGGLQAKLVIDRDTASRWDHAADDRRHALRRLRTAAGLDDVHAVEPVSRGAGSRPKFAENPRILQTHLRALRRRAAVPLSAFTHFERNGHAPLVVNHQGQFPVVTISFNLAPGASLGDAVTRSTRRKREIGMPPASRRFPGHGAGVSGVAGERAAADSGGAGHVYIVLGVLYESYIHPITILSTLPSAGVGALLALMICHRISA